MLRTANLQIMGRIWRVCAAVGVPPCDRLFDHKPANSQHTAATETLCKGSISTRFVPGEFQAEDGHLGGTNGPLLIAARRQQLLAAECCSSGRATSCAQATLTTGNSQELTLGCSKDSRNTAPTTQISRLDLVATRSGSEAARGCTVSTFGRLRLYI
jgi:hypothetical protein